MTSQTRKAQILSRPKSDIHGSLSRAPSIQSQRALSAKLAAVDRSIQTFRWRAAGFERDSVSHDRGATMCRTDLNK